MNFYLGDLITIFCVSWLIIQALVDCSDDGIKIINGRRQGRRRPLDLLPFDYIDINQDALSTRDGPLLMPVINSEGQSDTLNPITAAYPPTSSTYTMERNEVFTLSPPSANKTFPNLVTDPINKFIHLYNDSDDGLSRKINPLFQYLSPLGFRPLNFTVNRYHIKGLANERNCTIRLEPNDIGNVRLSKCTHKDGKSTLRNAILNIVHRDATNRLKPRLSAKYLKHAKSNLVANIDAYHDCLDDRFLVTLDFKFPSQFIKSLDGTIRPSLSNARHNLTLYVPAHSFHLQRQNDDRRGDDYYETKKPSGRRRRRVSIVDEMNYDITESLDSGLDEKAPHILKDTNRARRQKRTTVFELDSRKRRPTSANDHRCKTNFMYSERENRTSISFYIPFKGCGTVQGYHNLNRSFVNYTTSINIIENQAKYRALKFPNPLGLGSSFKHQNLYFVVPSRRSLGTFTLFCYRHINDASHAAASSIFEYQSPHYKLINSSNYDDSNTNAIAVENPNNYQTYVINNDGLLSNNNTSVKSLYTADPIDMNNRDTRDIWNISTSDNSETFSYILKKNTLSNTPLHFDSPITPPDNDKIDNLEFGRNLLRWAQTPLDLFGALQISPRDVPNKRTLPPDCEYEVGEPEFLLEFQCGDTRFDITLIFAEPYKGQVQLLFGPYLDAQNNSNVLPDIPTTISPKIKGPIQKSADKTVCKHSLTGQLNYTFSVPYKECSARSIKYEKNLNNINKHLYPLNKLQVYRTMIYMEQHCAKTFVKRTIECKFWSPILEPLIFEN